MKWLVWLYQLRFTKKQLSALLDTAYDILIYSLIALCFIGAGYFIVWQMIDGIQANYLYHISGLSVIGVVLSFVLVRLKSHSQ